MIDSRFDADTLFLCCEEGLRLGPPSAGDEIPAGLTAQPAQHAGAQRGDITSPKARHGRLRGVGRWVLPGAGAQIMGTVSRSSWGAGSAPGTGARGRMRLAGEARKGPALPWGQTLGEPACGSRFGEAGQRVVTWRSAGVRSGLRLARSDQASGQASGHAVVRSRLILVSFRGESAVGSSSGAFRPGRARRRRASSPQLAPREAGERLEIKGRAEGGAFRAPNGGVARLRAHLRRSSMLWLRPLGLEGLAALQAVSKGPRSGPYHFRVAAHRLHMGAGAVLQRLPGVVPAAGPAAPPEQTIAMGHWGQSLKTALRSDQGLAMPACFCTPTVGSFLAHASGAARSRGRGAADCPRVWRRRSLRGHRARCRRRRSSDQISPGGSAAWLGTRAGSRPGSGADDVHASELEYEKSNGRACRALVAAHGRLFSRTAAVVATVAPALASAHRAHSSAR